MSQKPDEDVGGDRHQFECDEDGHQIDGASHKHHSRRREENQGVVFGVLLILHAQIPIGEDDRNEGADQEEGAEEESERILCDHVVESGSAAGSPQGPEMVGGHGQASQCKDHTQRFSVDTKRTEADFAFREKKVHEQQAQTPDHQV